MQQIKTASRVNALNINGVHQNKTANALVFIVGGILAVYTIYSLFRQNKILNIQHAQLLMEIESLKKEGIKEPEFLNKS